jgi:arylsulfatase A
MVENMDDNINRILLKLDELGLRDNTIVIFFSDNGPNTRRFNGGMKGIKGSVDEGGVRLPFYISWPGKIKQGTTRQLAQDIDILPTLLGLCNIRYEPVKPIDGIDLSGIINGKQEPFDRYILSRQANQSLAVCNGSVRNDRYRLVRTRKDTLLYDMQSDPSQENDLFKTEPETAGQLLSVLSRWEKELVDNYKPVTTIEAGFPDEKKFTLPVQDAKLSGLVRFSSIHPNQSHTERWIQNGDSIYWTLNIKSAGTYRVEMQYGCSAGETGSSMVLSSTSGQVYFTIDQAFESEILPERDFVKRTESVERTWSWMTIGTISLEPGPEQLVIKLLEKKNNEAGLIKAIRLVKQ